MSDETDLPTLFIESYHVDGQENAAGGTMFIVLREDADTVLLGEIGLVEEGSYITRDGGEWVFTARDYDDVPKPPFRRIYERDKQEVIDALATEQYFYGDAIREAWENWSEGDAFALRIDGDEREFEADDQRLTDYDRRERYKRRNA